MLNMQSFFALFSTCIYFYIHTYIKVLAFDYDKHLELNRLYLDYTSIADLVEEAVQHRLNNDLDEMHEEVRKTILAK